MKRRSIKQQAKYAEKVILEENKEWHDEFIKTHFPQSDKKKQKRKKILFSVGTVLVAAVIAVIGIVISVYSKKDTKKYLSDNIKSEKIELSVANERLKGIQVNLDSIYKINVFRNFDSVSNDDLFFEIQAAGETTFEKFVIDIYVNSDYEGKKTLQEEPSTGSFKDIEVKYTKTVTGKEMPFTVKYQAVMEHGGWSMYIEYEQLSEDEQGDFFDFLDKTIQIA